LKEEKGWGGEGRELWEPGQIVKSYLKPGRQVGKGAAPINTRVEKTLEDAQKKQKMRS